MFRNFIQTYLSIILIIKTYYHLKFYLFCDNIVAECFLIWGLRGHG